MAQLDEEHFDMWLRCQEKGYDTKDILVLGLLEALAEIDQGEDYERSYNGYTTKEV